MIEVPALRPMFGLLAVLALFSPKAVAAHFAAPAGTYKLDPHHTSIIFTINHLGFSSFVGRFDRMEGEYKFDGAAPEKSSLDVTVFPDSVDTNVSDLDEALQGENWFSTLKFPRATFHATHISMTGEGSATITGDFTLHGVTHVLALDVLLTGAGEMPMVGTKVMGFHATGRFKRSAYGISNLRPMVGDDVLLDINCEFDKEE